MKRFKKVISVMLSVLISAGTVIPAFALEGDGESDNEPTVSAVVLDLDLGSADDILNQSGENVDGTDSTWNSEADESGQADGFIAAESVESSGPGELSGGESVEGGESGSGEDSGSEEGLKPGQIDDLDKWLEENFKAPEGYVDNGDGTYTKIENGEVVQIDNVTTTQDSTDYEWKKIPVTDVNGLLIGYKTEIYASFINEQVQKVNWPNNTISYPTDKVLNAVTTVDYQEIFDDDGNRIGYTLTTEVKNADGSVTRKVDDQRVADQTTGKGLKKVITTTTTLPQVKISEKVITIEQDEDGTIIYNPGVTDNSTVPGTSLKPDITARPSSVCGGNYKDHLWLPAGIEITYVNSDFVYQWIGEFGPHSAVPINPAGYDDATAKLANLQFGGFLKLQDKYGNDHYVYCADMNTPQNPGTQYEIENLEDALEEMGGYIPSKEDVARLQAIALNGYWGKTGDGIGSLEYVKALVQETLPEDSDVDLSTITPGMAIAATQAAIWYYANGDKGVNKDDPFNNKYIGIMMGGSAKLTEAQNAALMALYNYLIHDAEVSEDQKVATDLIQADSIKDTKIEVKSLAEGATVDSAAIYNADVSFILDVDYERAFLKDDLLVVTLCDAVDPTKEIAKVRLDPKKSGAEGYAKFDEATGTYIIENVKLPNGSTVTLKLSGTQEVKQNAYLITANTGYTGSQTFVGVEEGERVVDMTLDLHFSIKDPDPSGDPDPTPTPSNTPEPTPTPDPTPTPTPVPTPEVDIPDPTPPPSEGPEEELPDPEVPLSEAPTEEVEIDDPDVPLADVPQTGDISPLWYVAAFVSAMSLTALLLVKIREDQEAES